MKKILKFIPIIAIFVISIISVTYTDMEAKLKFYSFENYESDALNFDQAVLQIEPDIMLEIFDIAKENNVILVKEIKDKSNDINNQYISVDSVYLLYQNTFSMKKINVDNKDSFISTVHTDDINQNYKINDFLDNDRWSFRNMDELVNDNAYYYGMYIVHYENLESYNKFVYQTCDLLGVSKETFTDYDGAIYMQELPLVFFVGGFCLVFFVVLFFISTLFILCEKSKEIGCSLILGISHKDIVYNLIKKDIKLLIIFCTLNLLLFCFVIPNINMLFIFRLIIIFSIIISLDILISYLVVMFISNNNAISNIVKNQSLVRGTNQFCLGFKALLIFIILISIVFLAPALNEVSVNSSYMKDLENIEDYGTYISIYDDTIQENSDNYLSFYQNLDDFEIDYLYVDFRNYLSDDKGEIEFYDRSEAEGTNFRYATVDYNYLKRMDLVIYDNNTELNLIKTDYTYYIMPKSKMNITKSFEKYVENFYADIEYESDVIIYYYDDTDFETFDVVKGISTVKSPILRVISNNFPLSYYDSVRGLDIAGTGFSTALKFKVNDIEQFFSEISKCLTESNLEEVLWNNSFVLNKDKLNDQIVLVNKSIIKYGTVIGLFIIIYLFMLLQSYILFIQTNINEIVIKKLLGFKRKDMYDSIIFWSIGTSLIPITSVLTYLFLFNNSYILVGVIVSVILIIVEIILSVVITNLVDLDKIYLKLKGE